MIRLSEIDSVVLLYEKGTVDLVECRVNFTDGTFVKTEYEKLIPESVLEFTSNPAISHHISDDYRRRWDSKHFDSESYVRRIDAKL